MFRFLLPALAIGVCLSGSTVSQEASVGVAVEKDIPYAKTPQKELKLDMAKPTGKGPFPAIVCVHGGAWRLGSRKDLSGGDGISLGGKPLIEELAAGGYVAVSISYRLSTEAAFPAPIEDCKTAVRFLRANADKYGIDKDRIGAMGFSAGGHLVSLLALTEAKDGFDGKDNPKESSQVQAVVNFFGPQDLPYYAKDESAERSVFVPLLGGTLKEKPEVWKAASPVSYMPKVVPPMLFVHGTVDRLVPYEQSKNAVSRLKAAGHDATLSTVEKADHGWGGATAKKTLKETIEFFDAKLKKGKRRVSE